jgi:hypothetical protein
MFQDFPKLTHLSLRADELGRKPNEWRDAITMLETGEPFSLSLGERAGVRAGVSTNYSSCALPADRQAGGF